MKSINIGIAIATYIAETIPSALVTMIMRKTGLRLFTEASLTLD